MNSMTDTPCQRSASLLAAARPSSSANDTFSTTPPTCNTGGLVYNTGVDTFHFSYNGHILSKTYENLLFAKEKAKLSKTSSNVWKCGGHQMTVQPKGMGMYTVALTSPFYTVMLASNDGNLPPLSVQVKSEALFNRQLHEVFQELESICRFFAPDFLFSDTRLTRLDIFADFSSPKTNFSKLCNLSFVSRARDRKMFYNGGRFTGMSMGSRSNIFFRMYDKTEETQKSGKFHWLDMWASYGWDKKTPVFRVEFELSRQFLLEHSVGMSQIMDSQTPAAIWSQLMDWVRVSTPSDDTNNRRWAVAPFWSELVVNAFPKTPVFKRINVKKNKKINEDAFYSLFASSLARYMALYNITDYADGLTRMVGAAKMHFPNFDTYMNYKIQVFADKYALYFVDRTEYKPHTQATLYNSLIALPDPNDIPF